MVDAVVERIALVLLGSPRPQTSKEIARSIGMSESSVRHKMPLVRRLLADGSVAVRSARGRGFWVEAGEEDRARLRASLERARDRSGSLCFRRDCILSVLASTAGPLTVSALAQDIGVSRSSVAGDLDSMAAWLDSFGIGLVRVRNAGVSVRGSEQALREAIMESRRQLALEGLPSQPRPDDLDYRVSGTFYNYFKAFYGDDEKLRFLQNTVLDVEHRLRRRFDDAPFAHVLEYVSLMYDREHAGCVRAFEPVELGAAGVQLDAPVAEDARAAAGQALARLFGARPVADGEADQLAVMLMLYGTRSSASVEARPADRADAAAYTAMLETAVGGGVSPTRSASRGAWRSCSPASRLAASTGP